MTSVGPLHGVDRVTSVGPGGPGRAGLAAVVALAALVAGTGCAVGDDASPGPTVASAERGGVYELAGLAVDGAPVDTPDPVAVVIDAEFGELRIETGCGELLGSFSLLADGRAGMTVAGGRGSDCDPAAADQQRALVSALGRVDEWRAESGGGLALTSPTGDEVLLSR